MSGRRVCVWCTPHHDLGPAPGVRGETSTMCDVARAKFEADVATMLPRRLCPCCHLWVRDLPPRAWVVCRVGGHHDFHTFGPGFPLEESQVQSTMRVEVQSPQVMGVWRWSDPRTERAPVAPAR